MALEKAFEGLYKVEKEPVQQIQSVAVGGEVYRLAHDNLEEKANQKAREKDAKERASRSTLRRESILLQKIQLKANQIKGIAETVQDCGFNFTPKPSNNTMTRIDFSKNKYIEMKKNDKFYQRADSKVFTKIKNELDRKMTMQISEEMLVEVSSYQNESSVHSRSKRLGSNRALEKSSLRKIPMTSQGKIESQLRMDPEVSHRTWNSRDQDRQDLIKEMLRDLEELKIQLENRLLKQITGASRANSQSYKALESVRVFKQLKDNLLTVEKTLRELNPRFAEESLPKLVKEVEEMKNTSTLILHKIDGSSMSLIDRYKKEQNLINYMSKKSIFDDEMNKRLEKLERRENHKKFVSLRKIKEKQTSEEIKKSEREAVKSSPTLPKGKINPIHIPTKGISASKNSQKLNILSKNEFRFNEPKNSINVFKVSTPNKILSRLDYKKSLGRSNSSLPAATPTSKPSSCKPSRPPSTLARTDIIDSFLKNNQPKYIRFKRKRKTDCPDKTSMNCTVNEKVSSEVDFMVKKTQTVVKKLQEIGKNQAYDWVSGMEEKYRYLNEQLKVAGNKTEEGRASYKPHERSLSWNAILGQEKSETENHVENLKSLFQSKIVSCKRIMEELKYPYHKVIGKPAESELSREDKILDSLLEVPEKKPPLMPGKVKGNKLTSCSQFRIGKGDSEEFVKFKKAFNKQLRQAKQINRALKPKAAKQLLIDSH